MGPRSRAKLLGTWRWSKDENWAAENLVTQITRRAKRAKSEQAKATHSLVRVLRLDGPPHDHSAFRVNRLRRRTVSIDNVLKIYPRDDSLPAHVILGTFGATCPGQSLCSCPYAQFDISVRSSVNPPPSVSLTPWNCEVRPDKPKAEKNAAALAIMRPSVEVEPSRTTQHAMCHPTGKNTTNLGRSLGPRALARHGVFEARP